MTWKTTSPFNMLGAEANAAFEQAAALVKEGRYDEAMRVPMLPSDCAVIAAKIERQRAAAVPSQAKQMPAPAQTDSVAGAPNMGDGANRYHE